MVHNLRARNICGTSDKRYRTEQPVRIATETPVTAIRNEECSNDFSSHDLITNECNNSSILSDIEVDVLSSTRQDAQEPNNTALQTNTSFKCNFQAVIDETVFKSTYNNHKGASLYAIRKGIEDFGYNAKKNKNQSRLYVRECLENGKFVQMSGHGANGSFRLQERIHKSFIQAHKQNKVQKIRNVNATAACLKRFKRHDLEISKLLQQFVRSHSKKT